MAQITNYSTLSDAINTWDERTHDVDELIGLAEADIRLYLGPHFARQTSTTLAFTSGSAALPTGFLRPLSLVHSTYGGIDEAAIGAVRERRVYDTSGIPDIYAVTGSTVEVAPSYDGNLTFDYEAKLTGLSDSNATNWLIENAPQVYLSMCLAVAKAKYEDFAGAATYKSEALRALGELVSESTVAAHGKSSVTIPGMTP